MPSIFITFLLAMTAVISCSMNAIAKEKTQTVVTIGAAMPGLAAQDIPEMIWKLRAC